ncbi:siderophore-interacting protein [Brevibacterium picturae]|uniref:Siderophore-interacting protein n=2 Tax=Brevibacterium picturae TaxID=260553 RepID=A0ABN2AZV8_9MICO
MLMTNIRIDHDASGLYQAEVLGRRQVSPNIMRVTLGGADLAGFEFLGFDHWCRLALPVHGGQQLGRLPAAFNLTGYLKYLRLPKGTRPVIRNYTFRQFRAAARDGPEVDIDFVVHGDEGVAGPWARTVESGAPVAFIDQGRGLAPVPADRTLLVADESALPAVAGILRDLPRETTGHALIEVLDEADIQSAQAPAGMDVRWLVRGAGQSPGAWVLPALEDLEFPVGQPYVFAAGESALVTGARRHLVKARAVPKRNITFVGYWKEGRSS